MVWSGWKQVRELTKVLLTWYCFFSSKTLEKKLHSLHLFLHPFFFFFSGKTPELVSETGLKLLGHCRAVVSLRGTLLCAARCSAARFDFQVHLNFLKYAGAAVQNCPHRPCELHLQEAQFK
jgi:hypothetical protein